MINDLKLLILNRVIGELFQKADEIIKEGIKIRHKNKKMISLGMSVSFMGLAQCVFPTTFAMAINSLTLLLTSQSMYKINSDSLHEEVQSVKDFFNFFNIENDNIYNLLKEEFISEKRKETFFNNEDIKNILNKGILNLHDEEIKLFSQVQFNDEQEQYIRNIIQKEEKINVINFLNICMLEGSAQNKKYINLGGKNKTLKEIIEPEKKVKLMK